MLLKNKNQSLLNAVRWAALVSLAVFTLFTQPVFAGSTTLTSRSVALAGTSATLQSKTGVEYDFTYSQAGTDNLGSVKFTFCNTAAAAWSSTISSPCTKPTGLSTTSATFVSYAGDTGSWTVNNAVDGAPYVTRTAAAGAAGTKTVKIGTITNPSSNGTYYVKIVTYTVAVPADGSADDSGVVAFAINNQLTLQAQTLEALSFCVGNTVAVTSPSTCTPSGTNVVDFGTLSSFGTSTATAQMAASTNGSGGYTILANGTDNTGASSSALSCTASSSPPCSPTQTIPNYASQTASSHGTAGWGFNLKDDTSGPCSGDNIVPGSANPAQLNGNSSGANNANYNTACQFRFVTGDTLAGSSGPSDYTTYTFGMVANISTLTPQGQYQIILTLICTATF